LGAVAVRVVMTPFEMSRLAASAVSEVSRTAGSARMGSSLVRRVLVVAFMVRLSS
jgi:hypothetical protein